MQILRDMGMSFTNIHFLLFLPVVVAAYFVLPRRAKRPWLLLASYYFYCFAAPEYLPVLLAGTLFSYLFARLIGAAGGKTGRRLLLVFATLGQAGLLAFFKYNGFLAPFLTATLARVGITYNSGYFLAAKAMGISYYTFTAIGYFVDVASGTVKAEKNLLTHALFLGFFPSILSGPINRAEGLLPQLNSPAAHFDPQGAGNALRLMAVGFFKKLCIANTLAVYVNSVFASREAMAESQGFTLLAAVFGFMFQLYFDFSGYSDIAMGAAGLLGIKIVNNFNTPFFATNFSTLWSRWHISLSTWLQDYIFTPLAWSRWTAKLPLLGKRVKNPPVLSSILVVFTVSGLWHGDTLCFLVWGLIQAAFRIGEELLHRLLGKPKKSMPLPKRIGKTTLVFFLWAESHIVFKAGMMGGTPADAWAAFTGQFCFGGAGSLSAFFSSLYNAAYYGVYNNSFIVACFLVFSALCLALGLFADWYRFARLKGAPLENSFSLMRPAAKWALYLGLVICCLAAFILQSGGFDGANFIYGGF